MVFRTKILFTSHLSKMGLFVQFLETIPKPDNQITIIFLQLNPDEIDKFAAAVVSIDVSTKLMAVATDDIVALLLHRNNQSN